MRGARFVLVEGRPTLVALLANAPKDLNFYSGTMVGTSPTAKKKTTTIIPTYIIPVIVVLGGPWHQSLCSNRRRYDLHGASQRRAAHRLQQGQSASRSSGGQNNLEVGDPWSGIRND